MLREAPRLPAHAYETGDWLHTGVYLALPGHRVAAVPGLGGRRRGHRDRRSPRRPGHRPRPTTRDDRAGTVDRRDRRLASSPSAWLPTLWRRAAAKTRHLESRAQGRLDIRPDGATTIRVVTRHLEAPRLRLVSRRSDRPRPRRPARRRVWLGTPRRRGQRRTGCRGAVGRRHAAASEALAGTLTIYSGRSEALVGPLIERFEAATGLDVQVNYAGTTDLAATILEEGDASPGGRLLRPGRRCARGGRGGGPAGDAARRHARRGRPAVRGRRRLVGRRLRSRPRRRLRHADARRGRPADLDRRLHGPRLEGPDRLGADQRLVPVVRDGLPRCSRATRRRRRGSRASRRTSPRSTTATTRSSRRWPPARSRSASSTTTTSCSSSPSRARASRSATTSSPGDDPGSLVNVAGCRDPVHREEPGRGPGLRGLPPQRGEPDLLRDRDARVPAHRRRRGEPGSPDARRDREPGHRPVRPGGPRRGPSSSCRRPASSRHVPVTHRP